MASFIKACSNHFVFSSSHFTDTHRSHFPSLPFLILPRRKKQQSLPFDLVSSSGKIGAGRSLGGPVILFQRSSNSCSGSAKRKRSKGGWEGDGDSTLEAEILEFVQNSENPNGFPSKKDLIEAGRMDLVERISKKGGWLKLGWDLDEEEETVKEDFVRVSDLGSVMEAEIEDGLLNTDSRISQERFIGDSGSLGVLEIESYEVDSSPPSSSGRMESSKEDEDAIDGILRVLDTYAFIDSPSEFTSSLPSASEGLENEEDAGIEGILSRLEKERNQSYGGRSREKHSKGDKDGLYPRSSEETVRGNERSSMSASRNSSNGLSDDVGGTSFQSGTLSDLSNGKSLKEDTWRKFSYQRAQRSAISQEASETGERIGRDDEMKTKDASGTENVRKKRTSNNKDKDHSQIKSRIRELEVELTSVLNAIRSQSNFDVSDKGKSTSEELHMLSDASEFQETEIMNARDRLRSLRAQLAIFEGKMALTLIEARKTMELKQKKIDGAQKALSVLRTVYIVWSNPADEVFLVGSYDGWTSQIRMEKSSSGMFTLYLKLYPGRYEFKFVVDGSWIVDPLRPIVQDGYYQNNLLIVS